MKAKTENPVIYLAIDFQTSEYEWSLQPLDSPDCDAARLADFEKENPTAGRRIRARLLLGKKRGKVPCL